MGFDKKGKHTEDLIIGSVFLSGGIWGFFVYNNPTVAFIIANIGSFFCGWWFSNYEKYKNNKKYK